MTGILMLAERALSAGETMLAAGGVRIVNTTTVQGPLHVADLAHAVEAEFAARPLLGARVVADDATMRFVVDAHPLPFHLLRMDSLDTQLRRSSGPDDPPGRAGLIANPDGTHTLVLDLHHAICDGRSIIELFAGVWRRYTARRLGHLDPEPTTIDRRPPASLEERVADLAGIGEPGPAPAAPASCSATLAPLAASGARPGADRSWGCGRVDLDLAATDRLVAASRATGTTVHALLAGVLLAALRSQLEPATGALAMSCVSAVDLRPRLDPPLPASVMLCAASSTAQYLDVTEQHTPRGLGRELDRQLRTALETRAVEREVALLARPAGPPPAGPRDPGSLVVTNIGRVPAFRLPPGMLCTQVRVIPRIPAPLPVAVITCMAGSIGIDLPYQRAWFTDGQMVALADAIRRRLAGPLY